jgi:hypothetical protein
LYSGDRLRPALPAPAEHPITAMLKASRRMPTKSTRDFAPGLDWIGRDPPKLYPGHSRGEVSYMQPGQATLLAGPETNGQLKTR